MAEYLHLEEVRKLYDQGENEGPVAALDGVSLSVERGRWVAVMGPSGCGKSTLLKIIAGICQATSGWVYVDGQCLDTLSSRERMAFRSRRIGIVFQRDNLLPMLTVQENVELSVLINGIPSGLPLQEYRLRLERLMAELSLQDIRRRYPSALSGGEQQRVALARALLMNELVEDSHGMLMLLDEPTGNLDSRNRDVVCRLLNHMVHGHEITVMMVTHDPVVASCADRIIFMKDGRWCHDASEMQTALERIASHCPAL